MQVALAASKSFNFSLAFLISIFYIGENVEPLELEEAAMKSSLIQQIVVIGQVCFNDHFPQVLSTFGHICTFTFIYGFPFVSW
jgi:hypothetical protein